MLYQKIKLQIKEAMINKDTDTKDVLKMVIDKARAIKKEQSPNDDSLSIEDDIILRAINKELKQLEQTEEILAKISASNDLKLRLSTSNKITILRSYLPKRMTKEEIDNKVAEILNAGSYYNFGEKIKAVMSELKGKADNKMIKEAVEKYNMN